METFINSSWVLNLKTFPSIIIAPEPSIHSSLFWTLETSFNTSFILKLKCVLLFILKLGTFFHLLFIYYLFPNLELSFIYPVSWIPETFSHSSWILNLGNVLSVFLNPEWWALETKLSGKLTSNTRILNLKKIVHLFYLDSFSLLNRSYQCSSNLGSTQASKVGSIFNLFGFMVENLKV